MSDSLIQNVHYSDTEISTATTLVVTKDTNIIGANTDKVSVELQC
ncbi:hypothetical protein RV14_GL000260 [Enterococcus ratti]|uniref:Uncharacterized protein n=1 Tax=Enterococcus ratti TaxID=150033 RepID=A0A1L8WL35_9ENTE|nr:hypothetical protein RV14_GL000260 [Enterococcus ratti]